MYFNIEKNEIILKEIIAIEIDYKVRSTMLNRDIHNFFTSLIVIAGQLF